MRKIIGLLIALTLVVAVWTGGWFWLRGTVLDEMDRQMAQAAGQGLVVECPARSATGWPFRLEVACAAPRIRLPDGRTLGAGALAATMHVADTGLLLVSFAPPLSVEAPGGSGPGRAAVVVGFDRARASVRFGDGGTFERVSLEVDRPDGTLADPDSGAATATRLSADRLEAHLRPTPGHADGLDLDATVVALMAEGPLGALLPAPADIAAGTSISDLSRLDGTPAGARAWAAAGGTATLTGFALEIGETRITASGAGTLGEALAPTATLDATATGIAWLTGAVQEGRPVPPALAALGSAFLLLGRPMDGAGAPRELTIAVDAGAVSANGLAIATLPPLFAPGL